MGSGIPPGSPSQAPLHVLSGSAGAPLRGHVTVVACVGWLVGMWLALGPLAFVGVAAWMIGAALCGLAWFAVRGVRGRHASASTRWRAFVSGAQALALVGVWLAIGGLRGAWSNPAAARDAISHVSPSATVTVAGDVSEEPILEATGRLLVVDVHQLSRDGGVHWQPASGKLEVYVGGPDDWFAPAYGDALRLKGKVLPITGPAPAGILARMTATSVSIIARGGGSPLFAWLFNLRVTLAQGIQRSLPEPEAALLIGILLGLKTPVLRARLALFTATGTIHC